MKFSRVLLLALFFILKEFISKCIQKMTTRNFKIISYEKNNISNFSCIHLDTIY